MALLRFEGVHKRYSAGRRDVVVLDGVSFDVTPGDFVGVWGMRRSGKSTLLRIAAGIERPDAGAVRFDGHDITRLSARARAGLLSREIGYAPTSLSAISATEPGEDVIDLLCCPLIAHGHVPHKAAVQAHRALDRVGATGCADAATHELSPGEQTRVALARALIRDPRLLLIDEPMVTPSPTEQDEIAKLLRTLAKDPDLTLIVASEDLEPIQPASTTMTLSDAQLRATNQPANILPFPEQSASPRRSEPRA